MNDSYYCLVCIKLPCKKETSNVYIQSTCDNLTAIKSPVLDQDKVFPFTDGLGTMYEDFWLGMLIKPSYPSFGQFLLALQWNQEL